MSDIVVARLWTGQVIVGKLEKAESGPMIAQPLEMIAGQNAQGQLNVHMTPYGSMFGILPPIEEVDVDEYVMFPLIPAPQHILAEYTKATSRIVLPQSNVAPIR